MKTSKLEKYIQDAEAVCLERNGLAVCKNCGIDFKKLWDMVESLLAEQEREYKKKYKSIAGEYEALENFWLNWLLRE